MRKNVVSMARPLQGFRAGCATDKGDRERDQVEEDSEGFVARLEECADQGIRCRVRKSVHLSLVT